MRGRSLRFHASTALAVVLLVAATAVGGSARAATGDPHLEAGFPVKTFNDAGTAHGGASVHVLAGNVDEDPTLEIFATGLSTGPLFAWNADGSPLPGWPTRDEAGAAYPALGNLSRKSHSFEVVTGTWGQREIKSRLQAHLGDGTNVSGWPRTAVNYIDTPPMLADVDGDGIDEIFTNEQDGTPHGYRADGSVLPGWPPAGTKPWSAQRTSTPAAADLDGDGSLDIVGAAGEWVFAYRADGSSLPGFPVRAAASGYVDAYPAIGDVDGDGALEIVVVEGGPTVVVLSRTGVVERTMTPARGVSYGTAPALADLDGDDVPEIVVQTDGALDVWKGNGSRLAGWPVTWGDYWVGNSAPVVGDVDGDQLPDIVVTGHVAGADTGEVRAYSRNGTLLAGFPKNPGLGAKVAAPAIADLDLDGRNEIVVAGNDVDIIGYFDDVWVYDLGGGPHGPIEWGQLMGGPRHQGRYGAPTAPAAPPAPTGSP
ncbi:MAG: VCBS repeat-containing protein, partial [Actinomycetota bacterium]|nr:VCBS repeat-containing protein [Actinomycetota bacterium]